MHDELEIAGLRSNTFSVVGIRPVPLEICGILSVDCLVLFIAWHLASMIQLTDVVASGS
ncbi:hypothetical protein [Bradyrhizobium pachyrhizi]|uniref:hypothetical protein n=1 Tax=Bradyrhizobium pachyrhizi TaxID=280333 RepID=UPI002AA533B4